MAVTFVNVGTAATAASGNITPTLPTGWAVDDILLLVVSAADNVVCTLPAGWAFLGQTNNGATFRATVAWKRAASGEADPLVTHAAGGAIRGDVSAWRGAKNPGATTASPWNPGSPLANASSATISANAFTPKRGHHVIFIASWAIGSSTFVSHDTTNPTIVGRYVSQDSTHPSNAVGSADSSLGTPTTVNTATISSAQLSVGHIVSLIPATYVQQQSKWAVGVGAVASLGVVFNNNIVNGNRIIAASESATTGITCDDNAGGQSNAYLLDQHYGDGTHDTWMFSAPITKGDGTKPTVTFHASPSSAFSVWTSEYSGLSTAGAAAVETVGSSFDATTRASWSVSPSPGPSLNDELVIVYSISHRAGVAITSTTGGARVQGDSSDGTWRGALVEQASIVGVTTETSAASPDNNGRDHGNLVVYKLLTVAASIPTPSPAAVIPGEIRFRSVQANN